MRLGILASHPIQYQAPWFRGLAKVVDLEVFFCHRQSAAEQGKAGFGVAFEWDVDLLSGYQHRFLKNVSSRPGVDRFSGCDTPEIRDIVAGKLKLETLKAEIGNLGSKTATSSGKQKVESKKQKLEGEVSDFSFQLSAFSISPFDAFIVTGWNLKSYWQAVRACRRAGVPVLVRGDSQLHTPRSSLKRWLKELIYRPLLRQFDGFLMVGKRNREYLAHYGVPDDKMFFVPHFVDNELFRGKAEKLKSEKAEIRKGWGADDQTLVALFVGKFIAKKRPTDLLQAMVGRDTLCAPVGTSRCDVSARETAGGTVGQENERTAQRAIPTTSSDVRQRVPAMLAVFVGSGELGAQLREQCDVVFDAESEKLKSENLKTEIKNSPLLDPRSLPRASFAGFLNQTEISCAYAAADVLVLPSESETWGLVVNEAMACGLPAIVSDAVGCGPDLIEEGRTGFVYPMGDAAALAEKLAAFAKMKRSGHDFALALAEKMRAYSVESAVRGTVEAVQKLKH